VDAQPYLADICGIDENALLESWRWLLGDHLYKVFHATAMGDLILTDESEAFYLLDMIEGKVRPLATSESELLEVLTDRQNRKTLLFTFVVRRLREAGVILNPGKCYSPDCPLILGGSLSVDNLKPCDILVHSSIQGQIHRQVKDLPPGTTISEIKFPM